jgi:PhnB protein
LPSEKATDLFSQSLKLQSFCNMARPSIYLHFNGNCREAFDYYSRALNGKIEFIQTFGEAPSDGQDMSAFKDQIMHVSMDVEGAKIMGSDAPGPYAVTVGSNFSIALNPNSEAEAERQFNALAEGGQIKMPLAETFWAKKFGMLTDKFGVNWMVSYAEVKEPA